MLRYRKKVLFTFVIGLMINRYRFSILIPFTNLGQKTIRVDVNSLEQGFHLLNRNKGLSDLEGKNNSSFT